MWLSPASPSHFLDIFTAFFHIAVAHLGRYHPVSLQNTAKGFCTELIWQKNTFSRRDCPWFVVILQPRAIQTTALKPHFHISLRAAKPQKRVTVLGGEQGAISTAEYHTSSRKEACFGRGTDQRKVLILGWHDPEQLSPSCRCQDISPLWFGLLCKETPSLCPLVVA